ncbi:MAG: TolC family protein [Planctomycetota bacterium]
MIKFCQRTYRLASCSLTNSVAMLLTQACIITILCTLSFGQETKSDLSGNVETTVISQQENESANLAIPELDFDFDFAPLPPIPTPETQPNSSDSQTSFVSAEAIKNAVRSALYSSTEKAALDLPTAIRILLENSPVLRISEIDLEIQKANIDVEAAAFDWTHFIESTWAENNQPVASLLDGATDRSVNRDFDFGTGLRRQNRFGGNFQFRQDAGLTDSNSTFFTPPNQADANLSLELQQPILRGRGRFVAASRFEIANIEAFISESDLANQLQIQIDAAANAYWALVLARSEYFIQSRAVGLGRQIIEAIENRVGIDTGPEQLIRAKANMANRENVFLRAKYDLFTAEERLLQLIFGAGYQYYGDVEVITTSEISPLDIALSPDKEFDLALQNRPEIKRALGDIRRNSIEKGVAKNQLLPILDMTMAVSNRGLRGNRGLGSAFADQFNFGDPTYSAGLVYERPVGNRAAKSQFRQADLRITRFQQQLEQTISQIALDLKIVFLDLKEANERLVLAKRVFDTANSDYQIRVDRYLLKVDDKGDVTTFLDNLFSSQDRLATAQREYIQAITDFSLINIRLQRARGTLLQSIPSN